MVIRGFVGFLVTDSRPDRGVISPDVTRRLLDRFVSAAPARAGDPALASLTPRERDVLLEIAAGRSDADIAAHLFLEESTVESHVGRMLAKLDLTSRVQAVIFAYETGLVAPGTPHGWKAPKVSTGARGPRRPLPDRGGPLRRKRFRAASTRGDHPRSRLPDAAAAGQVATFVGCNRPHGLVAFASMSLDAVEPPSIRRAGLLVVLLLGPLAVFVVLRQPAGSGALGTPSDAVGMTLVLMAILPLAVIDARPVTAVVVSSVGVSGAMLTGHATTLDALATLIGVGLCAYKAGPHAAAIAGLAGAAGIALAPALNPSAPALAATLANGLLAVVAAVVGLSARAQRSYTFALELRSRELEQLRATEAREIVAQERLRIAREVHDVVGHALAAIALHARVGTRRLGRDPVGTARALEEITELAASALAETREAVGQLRTTSSDDLRPQRGLDDLDELMVALRTSDVSVALRREGDGPPVPGVVQSAAYRIVQESLSNVARHAGPANAAILVRREPQAILIEVSDDGRQHSQPVVEGHGLIGMRERVSGLGGVLEAGPRPDGGWRVSARLPTGPVST